MVEWREKCIGERGGGRMVYSTKKKRKVQEAIIGNRSKIICASL